MKVKFKCDICGKTIKKNIKKRKDNINNKIRNYKCTDNCKKMRYYISAYKKKIDIYKIFDPLYWLNYFDNDPEKTIKHLKNLSYLKSYFNPTSNVYIPNIIKKCGLTTNILEEFIKRIKENKINIEELKKYNNLNSINRWISMGFNNSDCKILSEYFRTSKKGFILRGENEVKYNKWKAKSISKRNGIPPKNTNKNCIEYWIEKGKTTDEAIKIISKNSKRDLNYFVNKYGIINGTIRYNSMCEKRKMSSSIEGYIKKYGYEEGNKKFDKITKSKNVSLKNQIKKYGYKEGLNKHNQRIQKMINSYSKNNFINGSDIANLFFRNLENKMKITIDKEVPIGNYICDGLIINKNLIIEFFGDYWHKNPLYYKDNKNLSEYDLLKLSNLIKSYGYNIIIIWESCMNKIEEIIKLVSNDINNNKLNFQYNFSLKNNIFLIKTIL